MNERAIPKPPDRNEWIPGFVLTLTAWQWITRVFVSIPKMETYDAALTPAAVNANSESVQTFTVTGLRTADRVLVNKPTNQSGLDLVHSWVSADDTLSLKYRNHSGGSITPTAETYRITSVRR